MTSKFTKIAIAAATAGAIALPASGALAGSQTQNALLGALLGGVAGAAVSHGRTEGVAIGAVAGAALGAATSHHNRDYRSGYGYRDARPYHQDTRYSGQRRDYRDNAWNQDRYGYQSNYQSNYRSNYRSDYGSDYGNGYGAYDYRR